MNRGELAHIEENMKNVKVFETWLFGKSYAWLCEDGKWELEKIEE